MREEGILKSVPEIASIERVTRLIRRLLQAVSPLMHPGRTPREIERFCRHWLTRHHATPALSSIDGFPGAICVSVNSIAVHGLPDDTAFSEGDIATIDIGAMLSGWIGDLAWSFIVGKGASNTRRLLQAAWRASIVGIHACRVGNRIGDIGAAISTTARRYGCSVLPDFTGHGIGRSLHEDPEIHPIGERGTGLPILPGMVLNIEPVLALGGSETMLLPDGWSYATTDGSLTAQFEHTVAVFEHGTRPLSLTPEEIDLPTC